MDTEQSRKELIRTLSEKLDVTGLKCMREKLFAEAKTKDLCDKKDELVSRRNTAKGATLKEKYVSDTAELTYLLKKSFIGSKDLITKWQEIKRTVSTESRKSNLPSLGLTFM